MKRKILSNVRETLWSPRLTTCLEGNWPTSTVPKKLAAKTGSEMKITAVAITKEKSGWASPLTSPRLPRKRTVITTQGTCRTVNSKSRSRKKSKRIPHRSAKVAVLTRSVLEKSHQPSQTSSSTGFHSSPQIPESPEMTDFAPFRTFLTRARSKARLWLRQSMQNSILRLPTLWLKRPSVFRIRTICLRSTWRSLRWVHTDYSSSLKRVLPSTEISIRKSYNLLTRAGLRP